MSTTLGALVQAYVRTQCEVLRDARAAIALRDEAIVHPARVAIRRLRATLRTFRAVYDAEEGSAFAEELRWAGTLLGDVRDLQVLEERFADTAPLSSSDAAAVVAAAIERDRAAAWEQVSEGFGSARGEALFRSIDRWHGDPPFTSKGERPARRVRKAVAKAETRLHRRLERAEEARGRAAEDAGNALHDARKAAKRHRYAVELAAPVLGDAAERTIRRREALQDALGEHQDAVVALAFLRRIDLDQQDRRTALALQDVIGYTRAQAEDVDAALAQARLLAD